VKRPRLLLALGAIAAAAVIVVVLLVVLDSGTKTTTTTTLPAVAHAVFSGGRSKATRSGKRARCRSPLSGLQCPFCRAWSLDTLPTVVGLHPDGDVKPSTAGSDHRAELVKGCARSAAGEQNKLGICRRAAGARGENTGWITDA
jgi:hypothetical protein